MTDPTTTAPRLCRSDYYTDTGRTRHPGDRIIECNLPEGHDGDDHDELPGGERGVNTWPRRPAPATVDADLRAAVSHVAYRIGEALAARADYTRTEIRDDLHAALTSAGWPQPASGDWVSAGLHWEVSRERDEARRQRDEAVTAGGVVLAEAAQRTRERDELGRLVVETRTASGNPDGATPLPAVVTALRIAQTQAPETVVRLVAGLLALASEADENWRDAETEDDEQQSILWHDVANRLRDLAQPGLNPAMNDGWTLRMLQKAMRDMERELADQGFETGSVGDGPYPPWEVALGAIADLRMDLGAEKDQTQQLASAVERLEDELAEERKGAKQARTENARLRQRAGDAETEVDRLRTGVEALADAADSDKLDHLGTPAFADMHALARRSRALLEPTSAPTITPSASTNDGPQGISQAIDQTTLDLARACDCIPCKVLTAAKAGAFWRDSKPITPEGIKEATERMHRFAADLARVTDVPPHFYTPTDTGVPQEPLDGPQEGNDVR